MFGLKGMRTLKPIKDFDGYFITYDGKVFCNLGRGNRNRHKRVELYELKPRKTKNGYLRVYMRNTKTNKRVDRYIHRLVAEYFLDNPDNYKFVNHKDCNRENNHIDNLEWCTREYNNDYAMNKGFMTRDDKGRFKHK